MTVEEALKVIVSMGVATIGVKPGPEHLKSRFAGN
jgi:uncharacterized membrane protein